MATPLEMFWARPAVLRTACVLLACSMLGSGCSWHRAYRPGNLPQELVAAPAENVETVDLSRLASYAVSNELIDRGDVLDVTIVSNYGTMPPMPTPVRIRDDGCGDIPLVGKVQLAGLEMDSAEQAVVAAAIERGIYRNPHITVTMRKQRVNHVTVIGAVKEEGVYELPRGGSTLLAAIVAAGGLGEDAGVDVEIRRPVRRDGLPDLFQPKTPRVAEGGGAQLTSYAENSPAAPQTIRVNLVRAAQDGNASHFLDDGDVVMVSKQTKKIIHVTGLVRKPGQYEMPLNQDLYLLEALSMAGGRTMEVANTVWVLRRVPDKNEPIRIKASVHDAMVSGEDNVRLAAGDIVSVQETPLTFVMDTMARFLRVGVSSSLPLF